MHAWLFMAQFIFFLLGPLVKKLFAMIGVGFVSYIGINALTSSVFEYATANMGQAAVAVQSILGLAKIDVAMNIYLSAVTARFVIAGVNAAGKSRRQVWTKPGNSSGSIDA